MTRSKFLQELRGALSGRLPDNIVRENVEFYDEYIKDEIKKGRGEEEVLQMLGDPLLIARTILDVPRSDVRRSSRRRAENLSGKDGAGFKMIPWKKIAAIAGCIILSLVLSTIISGLMRFIIPVALPALGIFIIVKIMRRK